MSTQMRFARQSDGGDAQNVRGRGARVRHAAGMIPALWIATAIVVGGMVTFAPRPAHSQAAVPIVIVDVAVVGKGYRVSKLMGHGVLNDKNESVGTIDDFIIGRDKVLFSILQVGGFLGIGSRLVAVPYSSLALDDTGSKVVLPGATKDELKKLPVFKYI
jgi:hypothetical protein